MVRGGRGEGHAAVARGAQPSGACARIVHALRSPALLLDADATCAVHNAAFAELVGDHERAMVGFGWLAFFHPDDPLSTPSRWLAKFESGAPFTFEARLRRADGSFGRAEGSAVPLFDDLCRWFVTFEPAPNAARDSAAPPATTLAEVTLPALLLEQTHHPAFAWELTDPARITLWNACAAAVYGFEAAEALGRSPHDLLATRFPVSLAETTSALLANGIWSGELRHRAKDGAELAVEAVMRMVTLEGGRQVVLETSRDVTALRRDAEALVELQSRLQLALAASGTGIWEWRVATDAIYWSPETFALLGVDVATVTGTSADFDGLLHADDRERVWSEVNRAIEGNGLFDAEFRIIRPDGAERWVHNRGFVERLPDGKAHRMIGTLRDIDERRRFEDELRASERRFQTAFHRNPQPTVLSRLVDGVHIDCNAAYLAMIGFTREEVIGRTADELGVWRASDRVAVVAPVIETGSGRHDEVSIRTKQGETRLLVVSAEKLELDGATCMLTVMSDVTDRRHAEEALRRSEAEARAHADELAAVLDATPAAVWIAQDRDCREVRGNRAGHALLRTRVGENLSKTALEPGAARHFRVFSGGVELQPDELPLQVASREGVELRGFEEEIRFANGDVVHVYGSSVPLRHPDGTTRGAIAAFVDVTKLKQAEAVLREADRRKDEFLAILSHELRNPLAPIVTATQLMNLRGDTGSKRERAIIERQTNYLLRLVEDLLDVSRIARGKVELRRKPVELASVVGRAVEMTSPLFDEKRHHLSVDVARVGLLVDADEVRLAQVVSNLLTNAARYTPNGGHIAVTGTREGEQVILAVRDDGVGIAREHLPAVFDLFVQKNESGARVDSGLGLGLALVRSLTTLHGGTVEARSDGPGRGSEFRVLLPFARPSSTDVVATSRATAFRAVTPSTILLVDDNVDAAELLGELLSRAGHHVRIANDPAAALALVEHFSPRVAILDIGLPVMDGYALGGELKKRLGDAAPLLVALTGYGQEHDRQRAVEAGFREHLVKPVDGQHLLDLVDALTARTG
jgi:PAS domain S-box-containing protein